MAEKSRNLASTYLTDAGVNISTGLVPSSAVELRGALYPETIVFEWDGKERGGIVEHEHHTGERDALLYHSHAIVRYAVTKKGPECDDD